MQRLWLRVWSNCLHHVLYLRRDTFIVNKVFVFLTKANHAADRRDLSTGKSPFLNAFNAAFCAMSQPPAKLSFLFLLSDQNVPKKKKRKSLQKVFFIWVFYATSEAKRCRTAQGWQTNLISTLCLHLVLQYLLQDSPLRDINYEYDNTDTMIRFIFLLFSPLGKPQILLLFLQMWPLQSSWVMYGFFFNVTQTNYRCGKSVYAIIQMPIG